MTFLKRALGSTAFAMLLAASAQADTIHMKNGNVIRGTVVGYNNGQFTVTLGGAQSRATIYGNEIDFIEFDGGNAGGASSSPSSGGYDQPSASAPRYEPPTDSGSPDDAGGPPPDSSYPRGDVDPGGSYTPASSSASNGAGTDVVVQAKTDWTPTQVRVRRGDRVSISASGSVQLDRTGQRTSTPAGVGLPDRDKLMSGKPTGALIAVVGDDNDDFIFVGQGTEFVAQRAGMLFLSVNEGDLSDNTGSYRARVTIIGLGADTPTRAGGDVSSSPRAQSAPPQPRPSAPRPTASQPTASQPTASQPRETYTPPASSRDTASTTPTTQPRPQPATTSAPPPAATPRQQPAVTTTSAGTRESDVVVQAKNDWTSTQIRVQRGAVIRLSATGTVQLDKSGQKTTSPAGIGVADKGKLLPNNPTGGLIAVIGDDNDEFIFVGQQGEFTAQREGLLFLSINEGELSDNTGSFSVHVTVEQPRTSASR